MALDCRLIWWGNSGAEVVAVLYDSGEEARAEVTAGVLEYVEAEAWVVELPLPDGGDLADWFTEYGRTREELLTLIKEEQMPITMCDRNGPPEAMMVPVVLCDVCYEPIIHTGSREDDYELDHTGEPDLNGKHRLGIVVWLRNPGSEGGAKSSTDTSLIAT